ncbi:MAG TPA: glycosyltransferase family 2 protein [Thermomicrobiales bacterium]|nr:glycosyltransferase family 2 protein [Thermomicrobiales bacterium]
MSNGRAGPPGTTTRSQGTTGPAVRLPGSFSLVLPAHNEEENIRIVVEDALETLPRFTDEFDIIVVNDGSRDGTANIINALATADARVKPIHHPQNQGYGAALRSGFAAATGDYVMFMDADRQFNITDLALLSPFVRDYDVVAGFRRERNDPLIRRLNAEIFNVVVRVLFGIHLRDVDCAFKVFRGDVLRSLTLSAPGALINTEMQAKLRRRGATVQQVAVHHYPRVAGNATGGNWRVIVRAMGETLVLFADMHQGDAPEGEQHRSAGRIALDFLAAMGAFSGRAISHVARRTGTSR